APQTGIASIVDNAGASTIWGVEAEGAAFLSDNLTANFALGYLDAQFDEFITLITGAPQDISDTRAFQNAPKWSAFLGLTWRHVLLGGDLKVTPLISHRSSYHLFEAPDPILDQPSFSLYDFNVVW